MLATDGDIAAGTATEPKQGAGGRKAAGDLAVRLAALSTCSYDDLRAEWRRALSQPPAEEDPAGPARARGSRGSCRRRRLAG
jgi:hypothetical protein